MQKADLSKALKLNKYSYQNKAMLFLPTRSALHTCVTSYFTYESTKLPSSYFISSDAKLSPKYISLLGRLLPITYEQLTELVPTKPLTAR